MHFVRQKNVLCNWGGEVESIAYTKSTDLVPIPQTEGASKL